MNADRRRKFNLAEPIDKKPRGRRAHGAGERETVAAYFFAKMYFETCALWFEAALA